MTWFVNNEPVDDDAVREEARMMRPRYMEAVPDMDPIEAEMQLRDWARENVFERMLLRQQASADPEPVPAEVVEGGPEAELQYRIERLVQRVQSAARPPKSKDVGDYYKKNKEQFHTPDLMHAAHIVKNVNEQQDEETARAGIQKALEELQAGADFAEVADRHSDCAGNGGDLGWFPRGEMVDEFDNVAFTMDTGAVSDIFRSGFGFHIVKVLERKPEGIRSFAEVKDQIEQALVQQKREKALEDHLDRSRAAAEIRQDNSKAAG